MATARFRWHVAQTWTGTTRCGGSSAPRVANLAEAKQTPAGCPRQANPPGSRLARGSPGGVWARGHPLYRRAIPGQRHGDTPAFCLFKPRARWWLPWITGTIAGRRRLFAPGVMELVRGWRVGFEPGPILLLEPRPERCRPCDLRFLYAGRDRWRPARIRGFRCRADPARTRPQIPADSRPVADASGALIREWPRRCKGRASCCGSEGDFAGRVACGQDGR